MDFDAFHFGVPLREAGPLASEVEELGFTGLWFPEGGRTAYLCCAVAATATTGLDLGTAIAVAFPRSPMVTAQVAWELAEATGGRFRLGLGTQVKAHNERRFSVPYEHPGPRLRDYVLALRAIFRAFQGEAPLDFHSDSYTFTMLPPAWSPGPIEHPRVPVYVAAVNPWMARMAGEVCDGVHVHPFHSARYLDEVIVPAVAQGAQQAGRRPSDVELACPVFTIVGDTEEERAPWREMVRSQISFYGSTRTYRGVFEVHGWGEVSDRLHALQRQGDVAGMAACITDEMLEAYAVEATWDGLADAVLERYATRAARVFPYFAVTSWRGRPELKQRWAEVARAVRAG